MLRTNSKAAKANIIEYIKQDQDYIEESYNYTPENDNELLASIYGIFLSEKSYELQRNNYINQFEIFKSWAQGLALGGLFCYYYNRSAVDDLGNILEETEEERNKYSEAQAEEMLTKLIYREIVKAYNNIAM